MEKHRPLSTPVIKNIYSAIKRRQDLSRTKFGFEFQDVTYNLSSDPYLIAPWDKIWHHDPITERPSKSSSSHKIAILSWSSSKYPISLEWNVFHYLIISCFNYLPVVLYYEVLKLGSGYDRIDTVFDHYLDWNLELEQGSKSLNSQRS